MSSASSLGDDGGGDAKAKKMPTAAAAKPLDGPLDLPYTIPLPSSYPEFVRLVQGRGAEDLHTAISRIRAFNAVALATDHKRKMQVRTKDRSSAMMISFGMRVGNNNRSCLRAS